MSSKSIPQDIKNQVEAIVHEFNQKSITPIITTPLATGEDTCILTGLNMVAQALFAG